MKGNFIKKLMAYALTAAMVISTPMTAFASEFADNFWISSGNEEEDQTHTDTGTVSATVTNTTVLKDNEANIRGIKILAPASIVLDVNGSYKLEAEVIYADETGLDPKVKDEINSRLKWRSTNNKVVTVNANKNEMTKCELHANESGFVTVSAGLDMDNDGTDDYLARVNVMVKRNVTKLEWDLEKVGNDNYYAGHTYDLRKYIKVNDEEAVAEDDIVFAMTIDDATQKKNAKKTAISADGNLTVDKSIKLVDEKPIEVKVSAQAYDEQGNLTASTAGFAIFKLELGVPATKLAASFDKNGIDIKDAYDENTHKKIKEATKTATITVTTKGGSTTDKIEWTSSNEKVAKVANRKTEVSNNSVTNDIIGLSVGKAKITATATSGKKASFNVTVKATLMAIDDVSIANDTTWSGKTTPVIIDRVPAENTDKLKVVVTGVGGIDDKANKKIAGLVKAKNYNIVPAVDLKLADGQESIQVTLNVQSPKYKNDKIEVPEENRPTITVKQSNVTFENVARTKIGADLNKKTERLNPSTKTVRYYATKINPLEQADAISWASSKETVATVDNGNVKVIGEGSAKITVSAVSKQTNGKYKAISKAFTIKSTPKCEEIVLKSNTASGVEGAKITLNVKQQLPKKAADAITWYIDLDGTGYKKAADTTSVANAKKDVTDKKLVFTIPRDTTQKEIKVLATTGSVSTEATVYVVESPTKKVAVTYEPGKKSIELNIGQMKVIDSSVVKVEPKTDGTPERIVRYDVDKNGVSVVKVLTLNDGRAIVCGIGEGKATVSAVTASGKAAKIKITVTKPVTTTE